MHASCCDAGCDAHALRALMYSRIWSSVMRAREFIVFIELAPDGLVMVPAGGFCSPGRAGVLSASVDRDRGERTDDECLNQLTFHDISYPFLGSIDEWFGVRASLAVAADFVGVAPEEK